MLSNHLWYELFQVEPKGEPIRDLVTNVVHGCGLVEPALDAVASVSRNKNNGMHPWLTHPHEVCEEEEY